MVFVCVKNVLFINACGYNLLLKGRKRKSTSEDHVHKMQFREDTAVINLLISFQMRFFFKRKLHAALPKILCVHFQLLHLLYGVPADDAELLVWMNHPVCTVGLTGSMILGWILDSGDFTCCYRNGICAMWVVLLKRLAVVQLWICEDAVTQQLTLFSRQQDSVLININTNKQLTDPHGRWTPSLEKFSSVGPLIAAALGFFSNNKAVKEGRWVIGPHRGQQSVPRATCRSSQCLWQQQMPEQFHL